MLVTTTSTNTTHSRRRTTYSPRSSPTCWPPGRSCTRASPSSPFCSTRLSWLSGRRSRPYD